MSSSGASKEDQDKLTEVVNLSKDEKHKLYDAIGYNEEETYSQYPAEYVNMRVKFLLKKFEIALIDGEYKTNERATYISNRNLLHLLIDNLELNFSERPVMNGLTVNAGIKSILLMGSDFDTYDRSVASKTQLGQTNALPVLIEPELKDHELINFKYELNPLDGQCKKRFILKSRSLKIVYHAVTINNIVYFFRSSVSLKQKKLKNAALRTISQVKERSLLFMKNNLHNIEHMDLNIDIQPSYLLMPQNGVYTESTRSICINFGHLSFKSEPKQLKETTTLNQTALKSISHEKEEDDEDAESFHSATSDDEDDLGAVASLDQSHVNRNVIDASYLKYQIYLKQIQILIIENRDELKTIENEESLGMSSPFNEKFYILTPLDLFINIHQCVYHDDIKLPAWKIFGNLPVIDFILTNKKLESIIKLFVSIPFPKSDSHHYRDMSMSSAEYFDELVDGNNNDNSELANEKDSQQLLIDSLSNLNRRTEPDSNLVVQQSTSKYLTLENLQQSIIFECSFEINEINLKLKEDKAKYFDFILFSISSFGVLIQKKTYDSYFNIYLNKIRCEYGLLNDVDGKKLFLISSLNESEESTLCKSSNLVDIKIMQTDPNSPTLSLLHEHILTNVTIELCSIEFVINLIAIKNVIKFIDHFQRQINYSEYQQYQSEIEAVRSKKSSRLSQSNLPLLNDEQINYLIGKSQRSVSKQGVDSKMPFVKKSNEVIELKLKSIMSGVHARVCTTTHNYFQVDVNKLQVNGVVKPAEKNVELILNSIVVKDMDKHMRYDKIVSLKESTENLINVNLTLNTPPIAPNSSMLAAQYQKEKFYFKNYLDNNYFDLIVKVNISKLRLMFLYKHLNTFLSLARLLEPSKSKSTASNLGVDLSPMSTPQKQGVHLQSLSSSSQPQQHQQHLTFPNKSQSDPFTFLYRIKLDVTINAPIIVVPQNSSSSNALLLDCGIMTIRTNLDLMSNYYKNEKHVVNASFLNHRCKLPPIVEIQKISLSEMKILR
jgi:vacuolar protein sorting-associated protein 13A/C